MTDHLDDINVVLLLVVLLLDHVLQGHDLVLAGLEEDEVAEPAAAVHVDPVSTQTSAEGHLSWAAQNNKFPTLKTMSLLTLEIKILVNRYQRISQI